MYKRYLWLLLMFSFLSTQAQELVRYQFDHFTPKAGLSSIFARKIVQDPFGFIWVGTADGLNRYNGKTFSIYNKDIIGKQLISGSDIRDLLVDTASESIWSVNSYGGIDQINYRTGGIVFSYHQSRDPLTKGLLIRGLALYKQQLFIGSSDGLFVLNTQTKKIGKIINTSLLEIDDLLLDKKGNLWIFCEKKGVCLFDVKTRTLIAEHASAELRPDLYFFDVCELPDGSISAGTNAGLLRYVLNDRKQLVADVKVSGNVYACSVDARGQLWHSLEGQLMRMDASWQKNTLIQETISKPDPGWVNSVFAIYFDARDHLWLGCQSGLAYSAIQPAPFRQYTGSANSETRISHAYHLFPYSDSIVYSCAQNGLYKINTITASIDAMATNKPFYHFCTDPFQKQLAGNIEGTFILHHDKFIPIAQVYPEFKRLGPIVVNSHCAVGDSLFVLGTENLRGIVLWNYKKRTIVSVTGASNGMKLAENAVNGLYKDKKNRLWVLGDHSISVLDLHTLQTQKLSIEDTINLNYYSIFFDVCQVQHQFYVASYGGGVLVLDSNLHFERQLSAINGLSANTVYKILPWRDSLLFVSSNNGVSKLQLKPKLHISQFYDIDGLHGNVFEENSGSVYNDLLYVGGEGGVTRIDPALLAAGASHGRLFIDQLKMQTSDSLIEIRNLTIRKMDIPNNILQTTIYFSYTDLYNSQRIQYAYRIKELGEEWIELGNQNFTSLIGLAPGDYHLDVRANREGDVRTAAVTSLLLTFLPKWYQTGWFKLLVLLCVASLLYAFYRYRLMQVQKQQQIRKEIASDLHDDIGSTLNSVRIFTHLAKREPGKHEHLTQIENSLSQASIGLRDMIWVLDDAGDTVYDVMERIKRYAVPVCQVKQIQLDTFIDTDENSTPLTKPEKRNLLLIAKEAVNNSIKYANCSTIQVTLQQKGRSLLLMVKDDGKGFDSSAFSEGNGLKNIRQRAKQINAVAEVASTNDGTVMTVKQQ